MTASKTRSNFFKLLPELRIYIYEMALAKQKMPRPDEHAWEVEHHVEIQSWYCCDEPSSDKFITMKPTKRPALLAVNRQVRHEAPPVYYSVNTFTATWAGSLKLADWLQVIGKEQAARSRSSRSASTCWTLTKLESAWMRPTMRRASRQIFQTTWRTVYTKDMVEAFVGKNHGVKDGAIRITGNWLWFKPDEPLASVYLFMT